MTKGVGPISAKVFVGNLSYRTTKEELVSFLSPAGEIIDAFLPTDRETGRMRGFGFITFGSPEQAAACIEQFNGMELGGRRLNINAADDRGRGGGRGRPREGAGGRSGRPSPIAEFKRGGSRPAGAREGGERPRRPPRPTGPRPPMGRGAAPPPAEEPVYDADERRFQEDDGEEAAVETNEWGESQQDWKKKKKKRKGSRRGLRAKKRSL